MNRFFVSYDHQNLLCVFKCCSLAVLMILRGFCLFPGGTGISSANILVSGTDFLDGFQSRTLLGWIVPL